jgi:peptidoglycan hydrolase-like protein with peptidoglycan-binding domain
MHMFVVVLIVSVLWLRPLMLEAGTAGTPGEPCLEDKQLITKDNLKLVQERLKADGVYAGPVDGEPNAQTAAALHQYQQKRGLPVSGAADEAPLKQLQIRPPTTPQGTGN